jgi:hypothetical protein
MTKQVDRTDYTQPESQEVDVFGSKQAKDILPYSTPAFSRTWTTRPATFTCMGCGQTVTQERYPGPTPSYCSPGCQSQATQERRREQTRERVRRFRQRNKPPDEAAAAAPQSERCIECGRTPAGRNRYGEGPRCASCWSLLADRHG